jgi:nitrite reductase/ring-hydroxylating ferredoxin subunit
MGVTMFTLALGHGAYAMVWYHAWGDLNPLVSLFTANTNWASISQFPFQPLGFFALVILFFMAATSHDFWLANLTPPVWKTLHMGVYFAYALVVAHVALGFLQTETSPILVALMGAGLILIIGLHLAAAFGERPADETVAADLQDKDGYVLVGPVTDIEENKGRTVCLSGDRVAIFRYDGKVSAMSNACQHQNGPLGEGRIIDGLVTCPWHGFQYDPATGASPPPFTEKVPTFRVKVMENMIWVHPQPLPPGTPVEPATIRSGEDTPI